MKLFFEPVKRGTTQIKFLFPNGGAVFFPQLIPYLTAFILNRYGTKGEGEQFYQKLEDRALHLSFSASWEYFLISLSGLNREIKTGLKLLQELLTNPNFTPETIRRGLVEVGEIRRNRLNNKDWVAEELLFKAMFPNTPLQYPLIGEPEATATLQQVENFFKTGICRGGEIGLVVGEMVELDLSYLPEQSPSPLPHYTPKQGKLVEQTNTEQAYIYFGAPLHSPFKKSHLRKLAFQILGAGGFGSRLMEEIRVKRGWAYSAYGYSKVTKIFSLFKGYLQTKLQNQQEAIELLKNIVSDFVKKGVTQRELEEAKRFLIGSEPLRQETPIQRVERRFLEFYFGLGKNYFKRELKMIETATLSQLNDYIYAHPEITNLSFGIVEGKNGKKGD